MIDLNKNQIVDPPVKCWVRCNTNLKWIEENLYSIDHRFNHPYKCSNYAFKTCSLIDPTVPIKNIKKWERVEDVPVELWGKALVKQIGESVSYAKLLLPFEVKYRDRYIFQNLHYLPLGQPLDGKWLPFESEVAE